MCMYEVIHFYFLGLTQDHFSDANCVPSGLAETVLDFSETLMKSPTVVEIGQFQNFKLQMIIWFLFYFIFVNAPGLKKMNFDLCFKDY